MAVLVGSHALSALHDPGPGHPEAPGRVGAALGGIAAAHLDGALVSFEPRRATSAEIARVHDLRYLDYLERRCAAGGGDLDPDTFVSSASFEAAMRAAGAGPDSIDRLDRGEADSAFLVVRPPGHHATGVAAMGFCLLNNIAVTAAALVARGERVLIVDWDAHHGNGTQDTFYDCSEVLYVSLHQHPLFPGTGAIREIGANAAAGTTINVPLPPGTAGDAYRLAVDELIVPAAELFSPTWLLVSAGFDAHRSDPLTNLGLSAGDFGDLTDRIARLAPPGRRVFFLEGGYDLQALAASVGATVASLAGERYRPEPTTSGGVLGAADHGMPREIVLAARELHEQLSPG